MIQLQKIERSSYMIQKEVFSERLKAAMKKQNVKQIDLVRAAQVQGIKLGKSHVSQYVSGKTVPRTDILLFLAKTLQVEEEWLIGVSNVESDTEISASNRNILDTNKTILGNSNKVISIRIYKQLLQQLLAGILAIKRGKKCVNLRNHPN